MDRDPLKSAWEEGYPVYYRLPDNLQTEDGNDPYRWITSYFEDFLLQSKDKIDDELRQIDPLTCDPHRLDFIAYLRGLTEEYWDTNWPERAKRLILSRAFDLVLPYKGTRECLEFLFNAFELDAIIWRPDQINIGKTPLPARFGNPIFRYLILVPLSYNRKSKEYKLVQRLNDTFGPAFCQSQIVYENFYLGFSETGDLMFEFNDLFINGITDEAGNTLTDEEGNDVDG